MIIRKSIKRTYFSGALDTLPKREVNQEEDKHETHHKFPLDAADVV